MAGVPSILPDDVVEPTAMVVRPTSPTGVEYATPLGSAAPSVNPRRRTAT